MDTPYVDLGGPDVPPEGIRLDYQTGAETTLLRVDARVERLRGRTEQSRWGTITETLDGSDLHRDWLVLDNAGVTHHDCSADLLPAVRWGDRKLELGS
jgi:hypothetical protein